MILGNYTALNSNPGRAIGGFTNIYSNYKPGGRYSFYDPDMEFEQTRKNASASFPTGTEPPYSWILAPKGGELSATTTVTGIGSITAGMASGRGMASDLSGSGSLTGTISLLLQLVGSLSGSGTITASLSSALGLSASLTGSGSLSATISLLQGMAAALSGSGTISANLKQTISMMADIYVNNSTATVNEIVAAVWGALAADYNESGTMGEKLNGAGSAGDPWTTDLTPYNTANTAGKVVKQIKSIGQAGL